MSEGKMLRRYVKVETSVDKKSTTIYARADTDGKWIAVETSHDQQDANKLADALEIDAEERHHYIDMALD
jgi:hypothetical protein